jgi:2-oxo-3-hexenedioate decarboxylase
MDPKKINQLAQVVDTAAVNVAPIVMLTAEAPEMTLEEAYDIQRASIARRMARGEVLVGMKMGLTSKAKMEQVGVHNPIYGHLTNPMVASDGAELDRDDYIHPRVEPEVCFILGKDLEGPVTPSEALDSVDSVCAALEVIDSRYKDFKFTIIDVVADNASSVTIVLGNKQVSAKDIDLGNLGMVLEHNGEVAKTGSSAAIYEHPLNSLAELANMLAERGEKLHAGQIVMSGGATAAIHVDKGDHVRAVVDELGTVELFIK